MNSFLKGILHFLVSVGGMVLPVVIANNASFFSISIGTALTIALNWAASYFIPTTSGASAHQG